MTNPAPGWYPDPGGAAPYRWWDGQAWTTATHDGVTQTTAAPAQPQLPVAAAGGYGTTQVGSGSPQFGATTTGEAVGATTAYGTRSPFDSQGALLPQQPGTSNYSQVTQRQQAQNNSLWHQNRAAFAAFIATAVAVMLVLSFTSPILIFTPIGAASAANQSRVRGEPLAMLAMGAAAITIVLALVSLSHYL